MMTRFEKELNGLLGEYWQKSARNELLKLAKEVQNGKITIDENGVARNDIGRVVMEDVAEKLAHITFINVEATAKARDGEVAVWLKGYKTKWDVEELRAAYGRGKVIVDAITGEKIRL